MKEQTLRVRLFNEFRTVDLSQNENNNGLIKWGAEIMDLPLKGETPELARNQMTCFPASHWGDSNNPRANVYRRVSNLMLS